jgi:hypothetical protein
VLSRDRRERFLEQIIAMLECGLLFERSGFDWLRHGVVRWHGLGAKARCGMLHADLHVAALFSLPAISSAIPGRRGIFVPS